MGSRDQLAPGTLGPPRERMGAAALGRAMGIPPGGGIALSAEKSGLGAGGGGGALGLALTFFLDFSGRPRGSSGSTCGSG
ncbi:hypothetical protein LILAB_24785 [Corallococcus macrosporus]|uniref:Uncharacterized protein n=1 Tax=Myxococcus fulvus (strain ATCC BAA-855 / HW-1) TaxID=483219 RepID=F8C6R0_MYXFH|nr:hypothetical protein LILAB_24785 [Corallococcus macrosporus]